MFSNFLASYNKISNLEKFRYQTGFGLVELMVSISIVVIVASIILTKQSTFNSAILLRGQAYEIALRAREIQLSSVSASNDSDVTNFRSVLGIHFDKTAGNEGRYKVFRDVNSDGFYSGVTEEFDTQGLLDNRFEISAIRVGATDVDRLSVIYARPNFDARFFIAASTEEDTENVMEIDVSVKSSATTDCGKDFRTVEFTRTGQISVKDCPII